MEKQEVVPLPESNSGKKEQISGMFDRIAKRYDLLNHVLSLGIDKIWRKKAIKTLASIQPQNILDIATGTGDFAIAAMKLSPTKITGLDISKGMLEIGQEKIEKLKLQDTIHLQYGDSEQIPFADNSYDAVTCAYGVRNFENLEKGLTEMARVMRPGGRLAILEFSKPKSFPFKNIYNFYFNNILPTMGKRVSKDETAYTYLPESVKAFPDGEDFLKILQKCGFNACQATPLTMGITTLYTATK